MTKKTIILLVALVLIIGVGVTGYVKREGITNKVNSWRATSLLADSKAAGEADEWNESERLVEAAWQLSPGNLEILRQWFLVSKENRSRDLLVIALNLFQHGEANAEDRREVINLFFRLGDQVKFAELISQLPEEERNQPEILELAARFSLRTGSPHVSLPLIRKLKEEREVPGDDLLLAAALATTKTEGNDNQAEAQQIINQLFHPDQDHQHALAAFAVLANIPDDQWQLETFSDATERLDQIAETTEVPPALRLLAAKIGMMSDPENHDQIYNEAINQFIETEPAILAQWMLNQGDPDRVLSEIATAERARESGEFFGLRVYALLQKQDWEAAAKVLENPPAGTNEALIFGYRGAVAAQRGDQDEANRLWEQAFAKAASERGRDQLLRIAQLAGAGNAEIRNRAVAEALKRPSAISLPAAQVGFVIPHLVESDSFDDMLAVSRNMFRSEPRNPALLNNVSWLELINGSFNSQAFLPMLEEMIQDHPDHEGFRSTLVLAYLNQSQIEKAAAAAKPLFEKEKKLAGDLAVLGLLKAKQGDKPAAIAYLEQADWKELMTRERLYFRLVLKNEGVQGPIPLTLQR